MFLLLDTEGPGRAPELPEAEKLARKNGIEIVYSSPAFEYWLLCHFQGISRAYLKDCNAVIAKLDKKWTNVCKSGYDKADKDIFDRLSDLLIVACVQALAIDLQHLALADTARGVNPSTQVYELITILIGARTGQKCPITGIWRAIGDADISVELNKGDMMPSHTNNIMNWQL